jgi:predicted rRNA methylase YqxC with S4 and FtsJ domains
VRDPALHTKAQDKIRQWVIEAGHELIGIVPSEITGTDGNQEFFACIRKRSA